MTTPAPTGSTPMPDNAMDITERLRLNAEMLRDGHQRNLTKLWHSVVVKDAAKDADEAAEEIARLRAALERAEDQLLQRDIPLEPRTWNGPHGQGGSL